MLQAHLRGLLEPDYPEGAISWAREDLILQTIAREIAATKESVKISCLSMLHATLGGPEKNKFLNQFVQPSLCRISDLLSLQPLREEQHRKLQEFGDIIKIFKAMKKSGIL